MPGTWQPCKARFPLIIVFFKFNFEEKLALGEFHAIWKLGSLAIEETLSIPTKGLHTMFMDRCLRISTKSEKAKKLGTYSIVNRCCLWKFTTDFSNYSVPASITKCFFRWTERFKVVQGTAIESDGSIVRHGLMVLYYGDFSKMLSRPSRHVCFHCISMG